MPRFQYAHALLVALLLAVVGCGPGAPPPSYPAATPAPASMGQVPVLLQVDAESPREVKSDAEAAIKMIEDALKTAGYTVVRNDKEPHNAVMELSLAMAQRQMAFKMVQDGKVVNGFSARVGLSLSAEGQTPHAVKREFNFTQGDVASHAKELEAVVNELNASPKVAKIGEAIAAAKQEADAEQAAKAKAEANMRRDEWREKYADECEKAEKPKACVGLERWMDRNRSNESMAVLVAEGKEILEVAKPKVEELADDGDWLDARVAQCLERATESGCRGVKRYLRKRPKGKHAKEAQDALDNLKNKSVARAGARERNAKQRKEAQRHAAAAAANERDAERQRQDASRQCHANCNNRCDALPDKAKARACLSGCQQSCP